MTKAGAMILQEIEEARTEGKESIIRRTLQKGRTAEEVSEFNDIPIEEVRAVADKMLVSESI